MSDTEASEADETLTDDRREALASELAELLGDAIVASHVDAGYDLYLRVERDRWVEVGRALRDHGFRLFDFLSVIDWLPSPFGRSMDAEVDRILAGSAKPGEDAHAELGSGYAGGATRFQLIARFYDIDRSLGVMVKADLPDDDLRVASLARTFGAASWHEREAWEMFGVEFTGHPGLRHLYLPGDFEGHPMRKDFPLLARYVKPWPGIVDVEAMPGEDDDDGGAS